jgi:hypothetical protein
MHVGPEARNAILREPAHHRRKKVCVVFSRGLERRTSTKCRDHAQLMASDQKRPDSRFREMTTNERLCEAGLMAAWDEAVLRKDRAAMIEILSAVDLVGDAEPISDAILADPSKYGF